MLEKKNLAKKDISLLLLCRDKTYTQRTSSIYIVVPLLDIDQKLQVVLSSHCLQCVLSQGTLLQY